MARPRSIYDMKTVTASIKKRYYEKIKAKNIKIDYLIGCAFDQIENEGNVSRYKSSIKALNQVIEGQSLEIEELKNQLLKYKEIEKILLVKNGV